MNSAACERPGLWVDAAMAHHVIGLKYQKRESREGVEVLFEDGVSYSVQEVADIKRSGGITMNIHLVKKVFGGSVCPVE